MIAFDGTTPAPDRERVARALDGLTAAAGLVPRPAGGAVLDDDDFLATDETLDVEPAEAPLRRYLRYQVLDFVKQRAVWLLALGLLGVYILWDNYVPGPERLVLDGGQVIFESERFRNMTLGAGSLFAFLATVFGMHGLVSAERERGLQRFLFAKPVARVPYYLQKAAVAFVGTLALTAVVALAGGAVFGQAIPLVTILTIATALFACVGGLTFMLSTLVRFDGGLAAALTGAVIPLRALAEEGERWAWLGAARYVLPPVERLVGLVDPAQGDPVRAILWAAAYGAAYVAIGIAVLRRRSILT